MDHGVHRSQKKQNKIDSSSITDQQLMFYMGRYSGVTFPALSNKVPRMPTEPKKRMHR